MQNFSNLAELFLFCEANFQKEEAFIFEEKGKQKKFSNQEFCQKTRDFANGLKEIGFMPKQTLAIFAYQSPIWLIVDFAAILNHGISVPIFYDVASENLFFQIKNSDVEFLFVDNSEKIELLRNQKLGLKKIITYNFEIKDKTGFEAEFISFEDLLEIGKKAKNKNVKNEDAKNENEFEDLAKKIKEDDLVTIIYTSGSTGNPKGVEITHKNLVSQIKSARRFFPLTTDNLALSFLPLAHIFENMVVKLYIAQGIKIYFVEDVKTVGAMMQKVKPTLITVVPRLLEKVYAKISDNIDNANLPKKIIGNLALKFATSYNPDNKGFGRILSKIFDVLVYKKIRQNLGGNLHTMISGGALLSLNLEKFINNIGIRLFVGYGLTETSPVIAANCYANHKIGTVGKLFDEVEAKINDDGELLIKGANVMKGYYKDEKKTHEVFTDDGWFKTGDLAEIDKEGFLTITGRKKELFKTATGKYVRPVEIEMQLVQKLPYLLGAIVVAEGKKFVSVLLFVEFENLVKVKKQLKCDNFSDDDFLKSAVLAKFTLGKIDEINRNLNQWERIRKFKIITDHVSIESGEITPSMKLRRSFLEVKYQNIIEDFYAN